MRFLSICTSVLLGPSIADGVVEADESFGYASVLISTCDTWSVQVFEATDSRMFGTKCAYHILYHAVSFGSFISRKMVDDAEHTDHDLLHPAMYFVLF